MPKEENSNSVLEGKTERQRWRPCFFWARADAAKGPGKVSPVNFYLTTMKY